MFLTNFVFQFLKRFGKIGVLTNVFSKVVIFEPVATQITVEHILRNNESVTSLIQTNYISNRYPTVRFVSVRTFTFRNVVMSTDIAKKDVNRSRQFIDLSLDNEDTVSLLHATI